MIILLFLFYQVVGIYSSTRNELFISKPLSISDKLFTSYYLQVIIYLLVITYKLGIIE